jgi:hypothetical protein
MQATNVEEPRAIRDDVAECVTEGCGLAAAAGECLAAAAPAGTVPARAPAVTPVGTPPNSNAAAENAAT